MIPLAVTSEAWGWIALAIGLVAALAVATLLALLLAHTGRIRRSVAGLNEIAAAVGANTAHIPELEATAPVLGEILEEAAVQDAYMNALTDGFGQPAEEPGDGNGAAAATEGEEVEA